MEEREQNTRRIRLGRIAATFYEETPSTSAADAIQAGGSISSREEQDILPTEPMGDQATDGGGDAAPPPVLIQDSQKPPQELEDSGSQPAPAQEVGASASASSSGADDPERARLRHLLASGVVSESVLTKMERELTLKIVELSSKKVEERAKIESLEHTLREERARGKMLSTLLTAARTELRLLQESEMMAPQSGDRDESAPTIDLEGTNDGDQEGAADLQDSLSSEPGPSDEATASSSSQVLQDGELAAGDSGAKSGDACEDVEAAEKGGNE